MATRKKYNMETLDIADLEFLLVHGDPSESEAANEILSRQELDLETTIGYRAIGLDIDQI